MLKDLLYRCSFYQRELAPPPPELPPEKPPPKELPPDDPPKPPDEK